MDRVLVPRAAILENKYATETREWPIPGSEQWSLPAP